MPTLAELLKEVKQGFYVVPEIQRSFVWNNSKIKDLAISISKNFPIGSITIWEMPNDFVKKYDDLIRPIADILPMKNGRYMVIDGQQRLTSMFLIKNSSLNINEKTRKVELYYNPTDDTIDFERGNEKKKSPYWFNLTDLMSKDPYELLNEKQNETKTNLSKEQGLLRRLNTLKNRLENYDVNVYKIKIDYDKENYLELFEKLSHIFVTLNSKGMRIRLTDLVLALLTGKIRKDLEQPFRKNFVSLVNELNKEHWDIDETILVRLYMAIFGGDTRFNKVRESMEKANSKQLLEKFDDTGNAIKAAINMFKDDIGVKKPEYLESKYLIIPVAYHLHEVDQRKSRSDEAIKDILRWILLASFEGRYTGKLESDLYADISSIKSGKDSKSLIKNLKNKDISLSRLEGEYDKAHLTMLSILYNLNRAKDWDRKQPRSIKQINGDELEVHHIFPKQYLSEKAPDADPDDAANITIISDRANESIGDRAPSDYLPEISKYGKSYLEKHFIPLDKKLYDVHNFNDFLNARRKMIHKELSRILSIR